MRALGPLGAVHLRSSEATGRRFYDLASKLIETQNETGCWLIINDRVDVAASVGAKGIQLASHSLRVHQARAVAPNIPIGISIHSVEEAVAAESDGAAWCVAGTVFETPTHEHQPGARIPFIVDVAHAGNKSHYSKPREHMGLRQFAAPVGRQTHSVTILIHLREKHG